MKTHISTIVTISLFFCMPITAMDQESSTQDIRVFRNFLVSTLESKQALYLGNEQFPTLDVDVLVELSKEHILKMARKLHIDLALAESMFFVTLKAIIVQAITLRNPDFNRMEIQGLYYQGFSEDVLNTINRIFN